MNFGYMSTFATKANYHTCSFGRRIFTQLEEKALHCIGLFSVRSENTEKIQKNGGTQSLDLNLK